MDCPKCYERLQPSKIVQAGPGVQTRRAECPGCLTVYTTAEFLLGENDTRGRGAYALAKRILSGKTIAKPVIEEKEA